MIENQVEPESAESKSRRRSATIQRATTEAVLAGLFVVSMLLAKYLSNQEFTNAKYLAAACPIIALTIW